MNGKVHSIKSFGANSLDYELALTSVQLVQEHEVPEPNGVADQRARRLHQRRRLPGRSLLLQEALERAEVDFRHKEKIRRRSKIEVI